MNFENPLGFYCPPNGTDPHYATEHDFRRFVAFGMLASARHLVGYGTDAILTGYEDMYELRKQFLNELENALTALPDMREEAKDKSAVSVSYDGDHVDGPLVDVEIDERNPEDTAQIFEWHFERYDRGDEEVGDSACLLFSLTWGSPPDTFSVWLAADAITDQTASILAETHAKNEELRYER